MAPPNTTIPRISAPGTEWIKVYTGPDERCFHIPEDLITYYSVVFNATLSGAFRESETGLVTIDDDDDNEVFEYFVFWLYHQRLPRPGDNPDLMSEFHVNFDDDGNETRVETDVPWHNLVKLYVFADKWDVPTLRRYIIDDIWRNHEAILQSTAFHEPPLPLLKWAHEHLPCGDILLELLVDLHVFALRRFREPPVEYPSEFLHNIALRYSRVAMEADTCGSWPDTSYDLWLCDYHEHNDVTNPRDQCVGRDKISIDVRRPPPQP